MTKSDIFRKRLESINAEADKICEDMQDDIDRLDLLEGIASNAADILEQIDKDFEEKTELTGIDISILFIATILQTVRWYFLDNTKLRTTADKADKVIKKGVNKIAPKSWSSILTSSVPYDAIKHDSGLNTGLSGSTHRYRTLGHDPVMGWIFGTMNILSDSLTKSDVKTTYYVKDMCIKKPLYYNLPYWACTSSAFEEAYRQSKLDIKNLPAAVLRQAIHLASDAFTKQGLPVPFLSTLAPEIVQPLMTKFNLDMYAISRSAEIANFINFVIANFHFLFYNPNGTDDIKHYEARTRKILSYSNTIATGSNLIYVYVSKDAEKLDIGGMLVTIHRLFSDRKFIRDLKHEFVYGEFRKKVEGV